MFKTTRARMTFFSMRFYGFQWTSSEECHGPPDTYYEFDISEPTQTHSDPLERVPVLYHLAAPVPPYSYCGNSYVELPGHCCVASVRPWESSPFTSGMFLSEPPVRPTQGIPYCTLEPFDGFSVLSVRMGTCHHRIRCVDHQTLILYDQGCNGSHQLLAIPSQTGSGSLVSIQLGPPDLPVGWTAWVNPIHLVPTYTRLNDYLGLLAILVSLWTASYPAWESIRVYRTRRTGFALSFALSQSFLFLWVLLRITYIHTVFEDAWGLLYMSSAEKLLYNLATLSIALHACQFLLELFPLRKGYTYLLIGMVLCVHIGFTGSFYFYWFYDPNGVVRPLERVLEEWNQVQQAWIPLVFLFDLCPILYTILCLSRKSRTWDPTLLYLFLAHLGNVVVYCLLHYLQKSTTLLRNDRNYFTCVLYQVMTIALHACLNVLLLKRLRAMLLLRVRVPRAVPLQSTVPSDTLILNPT
jgi:hypothetical protein